MRTAAAWTVLLLAGVLVWVAVGHGAEPDRECGPDYLVMNPDGVNPYVEVSIIPRSGEAWVQRTEFPSAARCHEAVRLLRSVTDRLPTSSNVKILTVWCDSEPYSSR